jgi:peptidoglycan-associated lipoprotein
MNKGLWASLLLCGVLAAGCSSTGRKGADSDGGMADGAATSGYGPLALSAEQLQQMDNRVIYFEFDESTVPSRYHDLLRGHGRYLSENPGLSVNIEGHADERGSREYNIALGESRADAVRRFLQAEGAGGNQITTISYGEERAADPGHGESAWALNRRAVLLY